MNRKEYWNESYTKYFKEITAEANDVSSLESHVKKLTAGDVKIVGTDGVCKTLDLMVYKKNERLLDYGCGIGRFYPFFKSKNVEYFGIDISESMIKECKNSFPDASKKFYVAEGESLPFEDLYFDKIVCYGVFDACYQEKALFEMLRVLRIGGHLFVTGKNTNYFDNDNQAYIAEVNARKKEHPNYFTDVIEMKKQLDAYNGGGVLLERFFLYRGDTTRGKYIEVMPPNFYEWQMVIEKRCICKKDFSKFSDAYSETWKRKNEQR